MMSQMQNYILYLKIIKDQKTMAIAADIFESYGTIRFINMFPLVIKAMQTGGTLVVDEFDASIHPMALMSIINVFHNDDVNIHHAQLVFNTHNPIFLEFKSYSGEMKLSLLRETMIHMTVSYTHYLILEQRVIRVSVSMKTI